MRFDQPVDHARRTKDALRFINSYWRGGGVPRRERQDRLAELRLHLEEATADGRDVEDVTGPDLAAFAAEWMRADRPHPWLDITLRILTVLAAITGLTALLTPLSDSDRYAIPGESLPVIVVAGAALLVADLTRMHRSRLNTRITALLYLGGVLAAGVVGGYATPRLSGHVLEVGRPAALGLLVLAAVSGGLAWWMRHTHRTRR